MQRSGARKPMPASICHPRGGRRVGTFAGGPLVHACGYGVVPLLAIAGLGIAGVVVLRRGGPPNQLNPVTSESAER